MDWAGRTEGRGNAGKTGDSFFHPSRPSGLGYLIRRKGLISQLKLACEADRMPFHPGNPGLRVCTQNGFASQDLFRGKAACDRSGAHHVGRMPRTSTPSPADLPSPSARHLPRVRRGDGWDALADIEVFVFAVEAELEAMERERVGVHRRGRKPDLTLRRRLIGLIWTLTFGGMQWRVAGWL